MSTWHHQHKTNLRNHISLKKNLCKVTTSFFFVGLFFFFEHFAMLEIICCLMKTNLNKKLADFGVLQCTVKESEVRKLYSYKEFLGNTNFTLDDRVAKCSPNNVSRRHTKNEVCTHMQGRKQTPYMFYI